MKERRTRVEQYYPVARIHKCIEYRGIGASGTMRDQNLLDRIDGSPVAAFVFRDDLSQFFATESIFSVCVSRGSEHRRKFEFRRGEVQIDQIGTGRLRSGRRIEEFIQRSCEDAIRHIASKARLTASEALRQGCESGDPRPNTGFLEPKGKCQTRPPCQRYRTH